MSALLTRCTAEEQRVVIQYLWSEGVLGAEIYRKFLAQYRNSALPKRSVYEWIKKLKGGWTSVKHSQGAEGPLTFTTEDNSEQVQQMIQAERSITVDELAYFMD